MQLQPGTVLGGKYRIVRLLGDGGMGAVYEVRHEVLGSSFAVKVLHSDLARRPGLVERFLREAHVSAQIRSPHVVQVFDVERTADGMAFLVMELLGGEPLSRILDRERRLDVPRAISFAAQILEALEAAHALGVVHRDLKPENVFVVPSSANGGEPLLKLIDFGIAKLKTADPQIKNLTSFGMVMGTPEYMAPEQAFSADRADARSDLFAVGVMLYEMLAGTRPASGDEAQIVAAKVHRGDVIPLVHAAPHVPRELAGLVHRAMAPRPELRFASAGEMLTALRAIGRQYGALPAASSAAAASPTAQLASTFMAAPIPSPLPPQATGPAGKTAPPDAQGASPGYSPHDPHAYAPSPQVSYPDAPPPMRRRRKGGALGWIIGIPLFLGAAATVIVIVVQQSSTAEVPPSLDRPSQPAASTQPTPARPSAAPTPLQTPTPTNAGALPPLIPAQGPAPTPHQSTTPSPHASSAGPTGAGVADAGGAAIDGAAPAASATSPFPPIPNIPPFPSTFPSAFPFPIPSSITLPAGFPPIPSGFPFPQAPAAPAASTK